MECTLRQRRTTRCFEVPQGCLFALPTILSYNMSELLPRGSTWCFVAYAAFTCRNAAFIRWDVYDSMRLWRSTSPMLTVTLALYLDIALGPAGNARGLLQLLDVIETVDFYNVPIVKSLRYCHSSQSGRATSQPCCDYLYYDPWIKARLTPTQFKILRTQCRRKIPASHPTGYGFSVEVECWNGCTYVQQEPLLWCPEVVDKNQFLEEEHVAELHTSERECHSKPT